MLKRTVILGFITTLLTLNILLLSCDVPTDPTDPSNTTVKAVIRTSDEIIYSKSGHDTIGRPLDIGAVIFLPENIDSVQINVTDNGKTIIDTILESVSDNTYDTIWISFSFSTPGIKDVFVTPYSSLDVSPDSLSVLIIAPPEAPQWPFDTLPYTTNITTDFTLSLPELCKDANGDQISYVLLSGKPETDTIINSTYQFKATKDAAGVHFVKIEASDPTGRADTLIIRLIVDQSNTDSEPPVISFIAPLEPATVIDTNAYTIRFICSDASGIDTIIATNNNDTLPVSLSDGQYIVELRELALGEDNTIILSAKDASSSKNEINKSVTIKYAKTYSVLYLSPGSKGDTPLDNKKYSQGDLVTIKGNTGNLSKMDLTFAGWSSNEDGSGTLYAGGTTIPMDSADIVLYAYWTTRTTYRVIYKGNGNTTGNAPVDENNYVTDTRVTIMKNTGSLVKKDSLFTGWNSKEDGSGDSYTVDTVLIMGDSDIILFAKWSPDTTVTDTTVTDTTVTDTTVTDTTVTDTTVTDTTVTDTTVTDTTVTDTTVTDTTVTDTTVTDTTVTDTTVTDTTVTDTTVTDTTVTDTTVTDTTVTDTTVTDTTVTDTTVTDTTVTDTTVTDTTVTDTTVTDTTVTDTTVTDTTVTDTTVTDTTVTDTTVTDTTVTDTTVTDTTVTDTTVTDTTVTDTTVTDTTVTDTTVTDTTVTDTTVTDTTVTDTTVTDTTVTDTTVTDTTVTDTTVTDTTVTDTTVTDTRYSVLYHDTNSSSGTVPTDTNAYPSGSGAIVLGNSGTLTKTGYNFTGWNTKVDGSGKAYNVNDTIIIGNGDIFLFAQWELIKYSITYHDNGGTSTNPTSYSIESTDISLHEAIKPGYTFEGWYENEALAGTKVTVITSGSTSNREFWAKWTLIGFPVKYNLNGGTNGSNPAFYTKESETITLEEGTKRGYTFSGWFDNKELAGSSITTIPTGSTGTREYWAKWMVTKFSIICNSNDGSSGANPVSYTIESEEITLKAETKTFYTFEGWYDNEELTGTKVIAIPAGSSGDKVFWAKWTPVTFSIKYNLNDGENGDNPLEYTIESKTLTLSPAHKTAYDFVGWYTSEDFTGEVISILTGSTGNKEFWAKWAPTEYSITYNNDGETGSNPKVYTIESDIITLPSPIKNGYTFEGWYDNKDLTGSKITTIPTGSSGGKVFWAKWLPITYSITYYKNGGVHDEKPSNFTIVNPALLVNATRKGYTFEGWYSNKEFIGTKITTIPAGSTGNKELWAKWSIINYTITLHKDGGTGGTTTTSYTINSSTINLGTIIKKGYTFTGWFTNSGFTGTAVSSITAGSTGDKVFWAKLTPTNYTITYFPNGGNTSANPVSYTIETSTITLQPTTKKSYVFDGWYTSNTFTTKVTTIPTGSTENKSLYAKWIIKDVDGNIYTEVIIGTQVWMVENLKTTKFRNGTAVTQVTGNEAWKALAPIADEYGNVAPASPGFCWYDNNISNKNTFGALYNWRAVTDSRFIAPEGWHIPSDTEIATLIKNLNAANLSAFFPVPTGVRNFKGEFYNDNKRSRWWSTTGSTREVGPSIPSTDPYCEEEPDLEECMSHTVDDVAWFHNMIHPEKTSTLLRDLKVSGYSVRCIRD